MIHHLKKQFGSRDELIAYVRELSPWAEGDASGIIAGTSALNELLAQVSPREYGRTRNFGSGKISRLSPYVSRGVMSLNSVRNLALKRCEKPSHAYKFIQELSWRDFWHRVASAKPEWLWTDIEPYKTGYESAEYADELPIDITEGRTGEHCIDAFIAELVRSGYLHNHARMYLASYVVHFRRVKWQAGARWFMKHLLDGDLASNNLSWQWVASTYSHQPYIFNLENVRKYFGDLVDTSPSANPGLHFDYDDLRKQLFPRLKDNNVQ